MLNSAMKTVQNKDVFFARPRKKKSFKKISAQFKMKIF